MKLPEKLDVELDTCSTISERYEAIVRDCADTWEYFNDDETFRGTFKQYLFNRYGLEPK